MYKQLFTAVLILGSLLASAQNQFVCGTDEAYAEAIKQYPQLALQRQLSKATVAKRLEGFEKKANGVVYIPVVFHIIHDDSLQNISQAQIMNQLQILNNDFRRKEGTPGFSSDGRSADIQIEFRLAQYDPNGNKHDGINRVKSSLTNNARDNVKALSYWNSSKYLNVWIVKSINNFGQQGTVLGYAQFPDDISFRPSTDGVVVRADQVGIVGVGQVSQGGRTLTHEVGHWLGLYHTFQDGCVGGDAATCQYQGDEVCDTPPVEEASSGCQEGKNSCTSNTNDLPDLIRNYMDYSDGTCMNMFTQGQRDRMYSKMAAYRNTIYGSGTNDVSYAGINPQTGGYNPVPNASLKAPYIMDFEGSSFTNDGWKLNNFNNPNNGWASSGNAAYSGGQSMMMRNFSNNLALLNGRDGFQSPEIDLTQVSTPFVEFYYAYAQRSTSSSDSLILFLSGDFGMNETRIFAERGNSLSTGGATTSDFIPNGTQWKKVSIYIANFRYPNARFRFEFVNRRGNNVFIDRFSISDGPTSLSEALKRAIGFSVYPNPMQSVSQVQFNLNEASDVELKLFDVTGKIIQTVHEASLSSGTHQLELQVATLPKGFYFLDFKCNQGSFTHKLLVN